MSLNNKPIVQLSLNNEFIVYLNKRVVYLSMLMTPRSGKTLDFINTLIKELVPVVSTITKVKLANMNRSSNHRKAV